MAPSRAFWSTNSRAVPSTIFLRFTRPQPWTWVGRWALVLPEPSWPPNSSVAVLARIALVIAGEGAAPEPSSRAYQSRTRAARPETSGAACDVPETSV